MKKTVQGMFLASALSILAAGLWGCAQDKTNNPVDPGDPTTLALRLRFAPPASSEPATRDTDDPNATADEAKLVTADVFIYTGAGDFLSRTRLEAAEFTQPAGTYDIWETSTPIPTTTGAKIFYVGVNLPETAAASLVNQSMSAAANTVQTLISRGDINIGAGLPMFSTASVAATMAAAPTVNTITANVQRIVAKVTVESDADMQQEGTRGLLGDLTWAINNQNLKYFLVQGTAPVNADPNWTAASYLLSDFSQAAAPTDYVAVNEGPVSDVTTYNAQYAVENTSDQKTMKELTRVTVSATFIPDEWVTSYVAGSGTTTPETNPNVALNNAVTFYTVTPGVGLATQYFANQADAAAYSTDKGSAPVSTYTDGVCYWNIFLNKAAVGEVRRNDFYKCNIKRIVAPGQPGDGLTNPNAQPETETSITVDINILDWNTPVMDDYDLIP
jgi:hypothetical protein